MLPYLSLRLPYCKLARLGMSEFYRTMTRSLLQAVLSKRTLNKYHHETLGDDNFSSHVCRNHQLDTLLPDISGTA